MDKKASEILLELEQKIDLILGYVKTSDLNYKLILDRLNKLVTSSSPLLDSARLRESIKDISMEEEHLKRRIEMKSSSILIPTQQTTTPDFSEVDEDNNFIISAETQPQNGRRDLRTSGQNKRKTQVQQKISYPDKKVVILASVEIYDSDRKLIKQTKTNSAGRWNATLDPGKYFIKVFKAPSTNKPVVEQNYEVDIPISDTPLEL